MEPRRPRGPRPWSRPKPAGVSATAAPAPGLLGVLLAASLALLPSTAAHADGIRDQQWAPGRDAHAGGVAYDEGRRASPSPSSTPASTTNTRTSSATSSPAKDMVGFGAARGDRAWARHGTAMAGIIAGHGHGAGNADGVLGIAPEAKILPVRVILEDERLGPLQGPQHPRQRPRRGHPLGRRPGRRRHQPLPRRRLRVRPPRTRRGRRRPVRPEEGLRRRRLGRQRRREGRPHLLPGRLPGRDRRDRRRQYGTRASFSTRRWYATVSAPGVDVVIADPDRKYYEGWGTSAAAAFVSGAVALIKAAHPGLTPAQIKTAPGGHRPRTPPSGGRDDSRGFGFVDPAAAIEAGGKLKPEGLKSASYGEQVLRLRPGPGRGRRTRPSAGPAPAAGGLGVVLLVTAVLLWRGRGAAGRTSTSSESGVYELVAAPAEVVAVGSTASAVSATSGAAVPSVRRVRRDPEHRDGRLRRRLDQRDPLRLRRVAVRQHRDQDSPAPSTVTRPMLLMSHSPVGCAATIRSSARTGPRVAAAAETPQSWPPRSAPSAPGGTPARPRSAPTCRRPRTPAGAGRVGRPPWSGSAPTQTVAALGVRQPEPLVRGVEAVRLPDGLPQGRRGDVVAVSIIAVAYVFSCAVSCRPASCAWSSSAARMSTFTMLAVSNARVPVPGRVPGRHVEHGHGHRRPVLDGHRPPGPPRAARHGPPRAPPQVPPRPPQRPLPRPAPWKRRPRAIPTMTPTTIRRSPRRPRLGLHVHRPGGRAAHEDGRRRARRRRADGARTGGRGERALDEAMPRCLVAATVRVVRRC